MIGGSIAQLAIAIVAPSKHLSIYTTQSQTFIPVFTVVNMSLADKKLTSQNA